MSIELKDVVQGNKLIADFMNIDFKKVSLIGYPKGKEEWMIDLLPHYKNFSYYGTKEDAYHKMSLKYHSSWDWLMPVIDDIYYSRRFPTGAQTTEISSIFYVLDRNIKEGLLNLSIEQTWIAVIKFIKWYSKSSSEMDGRKVK